MNLRMKICNATADGGKDENDENDQFANNKCGFNPRDSNGGERASLLNYNRLGGF